MPFLASGGSPGGGFGFPGGGGGFGLPSISDIISAVGGLAQDAISVFGDAETTNAPPPVVISPGGSAGPTGVTLGGNGAMAGGGSAFSRTASGYRARAHPRAAPNGRVEWFKPVGHPILFSKEPGQARRLKRTCSKAVRGLGG